MPITSELYYFMEFGSPIRQVQWTHIFKTFKIQGIFKIAAFIFSDKKCSKYPSLKISLRPSWFFEKIYRPLRFFTFHPFSSAFMMKMHFCKFVVVSVLIVKFAIWMARSFVIYILRIQTVYNSYTRMVLFHI